MLNLYVLWSGKDESDDDDHIFESGKSNEDGHDWFSLLQDLEKTLMRVNRQVLRLDQMDNIQRLAVKYGARFSDIENDEDLMFSRAWVFERRNMLTPEDLERFHTHLQDCMETVPDSVPCP